MGDSQIGRLIVEKKNKSIYVDGDTLIKVYKHDHMPKPKVINEAWAQALVEQTGLNVPKVRRIYPIGDDWAVDSDYIEGVSLEDEIKSDPANTERYIQQLVDLQIKVLDCTAKGLPDMKDKFNKKISALGHIEDKRKHVEATIRYELHVALDKMPAHKKLCHGDFLPDNILITKDGVPYIFDWAHASLGNGAADAAHTYLKLILDGHSDWAEMYMKAYAKASDTAVQYIKSWFPMVSATMLDKVDDDESIKMLVKNINLIEFE